MRRILLKKEVRTRAYPANSGMAGVVLFMTVTVALVSLMGLLMRRVYVTRWRTATTLSVDQTQWQNQYARDREYLQFHSEASNKPEPIVNSIRHCPCQTDIEDPPHWLALCKKHRRWLFRA